MMKYKMRRQLQAKKNRAMIFTNIKKALVCFLLIGLIMPVHNVWAHASMVKSDPPRRATLSESPAKIKLWFNEEIEAAYASVAVVDMKDNVVSGDAAPSKVEDNPKSITLSIPKLSPGAYKVQFRVLSVDGHVVESSYSFRIKDKMQ